MAKIKAHPSLRWKLFTVGATIRSLNQILGDASMGPNQVDSRSEACLSISTKLIKNMTKKKESKIKNKTRMFANDKELFDSFALMAFDSCI